MLMCVLFLSFLIACLSLSNGDSMRRELVLSLDLSNCPCHRGLIQQDPVFPAGQACVCVCVCVCVFGREREVERDSGQTESSLRWCSLGSSTHTSRPHIENTIHYKYQCYGSRAGVVRRDIRGGGEGEGGEGRTER